jgi:hypothetical protein
MPCLNSLTSTNELGLKTTKVTNSEGGNMGGTIISVRCEGSGRVKTIKYMRSVVFDQYIKAENLSMREVAENSPYSF